MPRSGGYLRWRYRFRSLRAEQPLWCTTCRGDIAPRESYRVEEWRSPLGGDVLTSRICAECQAEGL